MTGTPKFFVVDSDGVLTDGGIYYTEQGDEFRRFCVRDGLALKRLRRLGIATAILSNGSPPQLIQRRAAALGVDRVYFGWESKEDVLQKWLDELGFPWADVAYIGDERNDISVLERVGFSGCPADAVSAVRAICRFPLETPGGQGCVREFAEILFPDLWSDSHQTVR